MGIVYAILSISKRILDRSAEDVQSKNINDMVEAGAEVCAFDCPFCFETLSEKVMRKGIKPVFIVNLCRLALGEKPRDYGLHLPLEMRGEIRL